LRVCGAATFGRLGSELEVSDDFLEETKMLCVCFTAFDLQEPEMRRRWHL